MGWLGQPSHQTLGGGQPCPSRLPPNSPSLLKPPSLNMAPMRAGVGGGDLRCPPLKHSLPCPLPRSSLPLFPTLAASTPRLLNLPDACPPAVQGEGHVPGEDKDVSHLRLLACHPAPCSCSWAVSRRCLKGYTVVDEGVQCMEPGGGLITGPESPVQPLTLALCSCVPSPCRLTSAAWRLR